MSSSTTLIGYLDRWSGVQPDTPLVIDDYETRTYAQSNETSHRIANMLRALGCSPGSRISVLAPNLARTLECILGLLRAGCVWVPLGTKNSAADNAAVLDGFAVEVLLYHSSFEADVAIYRKQATGLRHAISIDGNQPHGLQALTAGMPPYFGARPDAVDPLAETCVFPTGGTTGRTKGAVWTHQTWLAMVANLQAAFPARGRPVNLVVAPLTHAAGVLALLLLADGATIVMLPGFSDTRVPEAIQQHRVTHLFLPPTAIYMLLSGPEVRAFDYSSLQYFIYGAAPMSVEKLREAIEVFGPVMAQVFGQAEAPMLCTTLSPQEHVDAIANAPERLASCGRPTLTTEVAVMDEAGRLLPAGEIGELVVRGPLVMKGYLGEPEATAAVSTFGWHHTGDLGRRDSDGYCYIVDRKRDMIISGGFNVYPSEIEQVLWSHPGVRDCAVIGVPDDKWGERVVAYVEPKAGHAIAIGALEAWCRERLGPVKTPKEFELRSELPRSAVGKVLKRVLRDEAWRHTGRRI